MKEKIKTLVSKYSHAFLLLYIIPYLYWFFALEEHAEPRYWISSWFDSLIPFHEIFVIPYLLWFFYMAVFVCYFFFTSREDYYRLCTFLFTGMTICLLIYTFFPNGQHLRPAYFSRDNFLVDLVRQLYRSDTPTNVCPSIHCLNSIGVHIALRRSTVGKKYPLLRISSFVLMILICLSTVFLKQHSVIDFIAAVILSVPLYFLAYRSFSSDTERSRKKVFRTSYIR